MPVEATIDPDLPVIDIVRLHPEARPILARHGLDTCCGGTHPLKMAAAAHKVPLEPLLEEIAQAAEARAAAPPAPASFITAEMSVREIMQRWPCTALVFGRHGLMGCGGAEGPDGPVGWFARVHNVDVDVLLRDLGDAARAGRLPVVPVAPAAEPPVIYPPFLKVAFLFTFTGGTTLGVIALILMALRGRLGSISGALIQAHGHVQLYGWVAIFIMGVAYHILPRLKGGDLPGTFLPKLSLAAMTAGVILRGIAQSADLGQASRLLFFLGGNLEVVAVLLFISLCAPLLWERPSRERFERFLTAGNFFFAAATFIQVGAVSALFAMETLAVPAFLETPFLSVFLMGFVAFWILGVSVRTLPVFMGLAEPWRPGLSFAFWTLTFGVPLLSLGQGMFISDPGGAGRFILAAGAALTAAGALVFPVALKVFGPPEPSGPGMESDRGFEKFVRAAYGWLAISALMLGAISFAPLATGEAVPHAYVGAFRHALTVGFVTMMMVGMGSRIIPVFSGIALRSPAMREASFWLILVGCTIRVIFQSLSEPYGPNFLRISGVSGVLELAGMILFAWNIWGTLGRARGAAAGAGEMSASPMIRVRPPAAGAGRPESDGAEDLPILPETSVGALLEARPDLLEVFVENGFTQLANPVLRRTFARYVSIARACRMHGVDCDRLLAQLRAAVSAADSSR